MGNRLLGLRPGCGAPDIALTLTQEQAEALGIVKCKWCGYPPNNHFNWDRTPLPTGVCAHDKRCPGYEQVVVLPKV